MSNFLRWLTFNLWYFGKPPWDTGVSPPELSAFITAHPPGRALDVGCGTGVNVAALASAGWQVVGVDFALPAVLAARRRMRRAGLTADILAADVTHLPDLGRPFDLIFDLGCFFNLPLHAKIAYRRSLDNLLAPSATVLMYAYLNKQPGGFGLTEDDIASFSRDLNLVSRVDSLDVCARPSTWLNWRR